MNGTRKQYTTETDERQALPGLYDHDLERATIAGCLYDPALFATLPLAASDFHEGYCATVWAYCQEKAQRGELVDTMILTGYLVDHEIIPLAALTAILATETTPGMAAAYADKVAEMAEQRIYFDVADALARAVGSGDGWRSATTDALARLDSKRPKARRATWTADALLTAEFPAPRWAVSDLIPVGLTLLAGRPKIGKSWLMLQIAEAVGAGGKALGRDVEAGAVLYLALEDSPRRLKDRLRAHHAPAGLAVNFHMEWRGLLDGGIEDLRAELQRGHESGQPYRLVIIDTLGRLLAGLDQRVTGDVTQTYGALQKLAMAADVAIVGVEHHRKTAGQAWSDVIGDIMESTSKPGAADAVLGLYRERGKSEAVLKATGRDLDEAELALTFDRQLACWQYVGTAETVRADSEKGRVLEAIRTLTELGELTTTAAIAETAGMDRGNASHVLADLLEAGRVRKAAKVGREQPYELA